MKWYYKILIFVCVVIFSPIIILGICGALVAHLFEIPKNKKEYINSEYFLNFNLPYKRYRLFLPEYRFYNSMKKRKLEVDYKRQESNSFEYFIYKKVLYIFPDFEQIDFNADKAVWEVDYDGDWKPFEDAYKNLVSKLNGEINVSCIKLLVERKMFPLTDLNGIDIPECIFLTWGYENAFENEDSPLKLCVPTKTTELFDMMKQTPDLCGDYHIANNGTIVWDLYDSFQIEIGVDPRDCYLGIDKKIGKIKSGITHWHPNIYEIYHEVCQIGKKGNVLVLGSSVLGTGVLYLGEKENCPYNTPTKRILYILEAK